MHSIIRITLLFTLIAIANQLFLYNNSGECIAKIPLYETKFINSDLLNTQKIINFIIYSVKIILFNITSLIITKIVLSTILVNISNNSKYDIKDYIINIISIFIIWILPTNHGDTGDIYCTKNTFWIISKYFYGIFILTEYGIFHPIKTATVTLYKKSSKQI